MSEDEAKTKWCTMARVAIVHVSGNGMTVGHTVANRLDNGKYPFHSNCIGSGCMVWRRVTVGGEGFCGMAGKND